MTFPPRPGERRPGRCADSGGPDRHGVREFAANDTTLRFSRRRTGELAAARTSPARTFKFAGAEQANSPASPPDAARTCRKDEFPSAGAGSLLPCSDGIIRGASGLEFVFINARVGSSGKALNIAPCGNALGSFDVRSLIRKAGKRLAAVACRGDHAISGVVPSR